MFAVTVSEKGGSARREVFERAEISVGRVQGNDLVLARGNVSKRHARLLFRDGRFIVTDLKSTNGTFVNGRRISQATIVREADKIYVGDFVLRVESLAGERATSAATANGSSPDGRVASSADGRGASTPREASPVESRGLDEDELTGAGIPRMPAPPRLPTLPLAAATGQEPPAAPSSAVATPLVRSSSTPGQVPASAAVPPRPDAASRRRDAVARLVERVAAALDRAALVAAGDAIAARVDRLLHELAEPGLDGDEAAATLRDARRELLGLGPIEPLLDDPEIAEVQVLQRDRVVVVRDGERVDTGLAFSSDEALRWTIERLAAESGTPLRAGESVAHRALGARGLELEAILPPVAREGHVLATRRARAAARSLDELVRSHALSRPMATLLEQAALARVNLLVVGAPLATAASLAPALAAAAGSSARVVTIGLDAAHRPPAAVALEPDGAGAAIVQAAARLEPEQLVVAPLAGALALDALDAIARGATGVVALLAAPTLRAGAERLVAELVAARGASFDGSRARLAAAFDLALEVSRGRDGRLRVVRVVELDGVDGGQLVTRELFAWRPERGGDGGFVASGYVPRFAHESTREPGLDPALVRRVPR